MSEDPEKTEALRRMIEHSDVAGIQKLLQGDGIDAAELVRLMEERLASFSRERGPKVGSPERLLKEAISVGDVGKVAALIEAGADIKFRARPPGLKADRPCSARSSRGSG